MSITINFNNETDHIPCFDPISYLKKAIELKNIQQTQLDISFIKDKHMVQLHKKHLNINTSTDILTFNLNSTAEPEADIYICVDEAKRNAIDLNHPLDTELKTLLLHGLLHCIGYDDTTPELKNIMFKEQDRLLIKLEDK